MRCPSLYSAYGSTWREAGAPLTSGWQAALLLHSISYSWLDALHALAVPLLVPLVLYNQVTLPSYPLSPMYPIRLSYTLAYTVSPFFDTLTHRYAYNLLTSALCFFSCHYQLCQTKVQSYPFPYICSILPYPTLTQPKISYPPPSW